MKKYLFSFILGTLLMAGCTEATIDAVPDATNVADATHDNNGLYTLEKMQDAADEVFGATRGGYAPQLLPTSLYVEFTPTTQQQAEQLLSCKELNLTTHSVLEKTVFPEGQDFYCPEPTEGLSKFYCFVKSDYVMPEGIEYKVLKTF